MSKMDIKITDNHDKFINALAHQLRDAMNEVGQQAVARAKETVPVDTGNLQNSINYSVSDNGVKVGTDVEYGKYVELGSVRNPAASHFLRDAMQNHTNEYKQTIKSHLKK